MEEIGTQFWSYNYVSSTADRFRTGIRITGILNLKMEGQSENLYEVAKATNTHSL